MMTRRHFFKWAVAAACSCRLGNLRSAFASMEPEGEKERVLRLHNIHTGERLHTRYWAHGNYDKEELGRINYFLRCHYANTVKPISTRVIDLLCEVKRCVACDREITIISGYRSPEYNEYLRRMGRKVAETSLHLAGQAIDFAIPGFRTESLARVAADFQAGGVGLYQEFVHIDVGRVRRW